MSFDRLAWADRHDVDFVVRCTLVDTTVGAVTVVLVDVLDDQRPELAFVPDDRAVQQFMAQCADPLFGVRVRLG